MPFSLLQTIREPTPPSKEDGKPFVVEDGSTSEQQKPGGLVSPEELHSILYCWRNSILSHAKMEMAEDEIAAARETVHCDAMD